LYKRFSTATSYNECFRRCADELPVCLDSFCSSVCVGLNFELFEGLLKTIERAKSSGSFRYRLVNHLLPPCIVVFSGGTASSVISSVLGLLTWRMVSLDSPYSPLYTILIVFCGSLFAALLLFPNIGFRGLYCYTVRWLVVLKRTVLCGDSCSVTICVS